MSPTGADKRRGGRSQAVAGSNVGRDLIQIMTEQVVVPGPSSRVNRASPVPVQASRVKTTGESSTASKIGGLIVIALIVLGVASSCGAFDASIPSTAQDVTDSALRSSLLSLVRQAIIGCSHERVAQSNRCPQEASQVLPGTSVRWSLIGDPVEGAVVQEQAPVAYVMGIATMTWEYAQPASPGLASSFELVEVPYYAEVALSDPLNLLKIVHSNALRPEPVAKPAPAHAGDSAVQVIRSFIGSCAVVRSLSQPHGCPAYVYPPGLDDLARPRWTLGSDAGLNARVDWDEAKGLVHVTGHLNMVLWDDRKPRAKMDTEYDAWLTPEGQGPSTVIGVFPQTTYTFF